MQKIEALGMYVIYGLIDPRDQSVHYVGLTKDAFSRFLQHIQCAGNNYAKNAWMHELRAANVVPIMKTLEVTAQYDYALLREEYWIGHFEVLGEPLCNVNKSSSPRIARKVSRKAVHLAKQQTREVTKIIEVVGNAEIIKADLNDGITLALREIGKRLKKGDTKVDIVKSFGLPYGRATQEIGAVVDMVAEEIEAEG